MGSGPRFAIYRADGFGLGLVFSRFPYAVTFTVLFFVWQIYVGLGKPYDAPNEDGASE